MTQHKLTAGAGYTYMTRQPSATNGPPQDHPNRNRNPSTPRFASGLRVAGGTKAMSARRRWRARDTGSDGLSPRGCLTQTAMGSSCRDASGVAAVVAGHPVSVLAPHRGIDAAGSVACSVASRTNAGAGHHRWNPRSSQTAAAAWYPPARLPGIPGWTPPPPM